MNRQIIAKNKNDGIQRPVYTIKIKGRTRYAREVLINGPLRCVYDAKGLPCGAKAYIEIDHENITLIDKMSFKEAKDHGITG